MVIFFRNQLIPWIKGENLERIKKYREEFTVPKKGEARLIKQGKEIRDIKDVMAASQEKKHNLPENWVKLSTEKQQKIKLYTDGTAPTDIDPAKIKKIIANTDELTVTLEIHWYENKKTGEMVDIKDKVDIPKKYLKKFLDK